LRAKFSTALLLAIASLLLVIMVAVAIVGSKILRDTITDSARQSVTTASHYFRQQLGVRAEEVAGAVSVLVEDFGFRDALASGDHATILSAVDNQSSRIGATAYSIRMNDGRTISAANTPFSVSGFAGNETAMTVKITAINNVPHLIISTPVGNPTILGILTLGFEMSDSFVEQMKELVGADISFVAGPSGSSERGLFSTLSRAGTPRDARQHIAAMEAVTTGSPTVLTIADQRFMTTPVDLQSAELFNAYLHIPMTDEASAFRQVGLQLSLLAGGAFLLVLVMSSWLSRRLTRPLGELGAAATKIGGGDYHVAIPQQSIRECRKLLMSVSKPFSSRHVGTISPAFPIGLPPSNALPVKSITVKAARHSHYCRWIFIICAKSMTLWAMKLAITCCAGWAAHYRPIACEIPPSVASLPMIFW
jgi:HAMP domain-containing protein